MTEKQKQFLLLFEPVHNRLIRFVRLMTYDVEEQRDLVSDTILIAYEHFEKIRSKTAFMSYLFTVASRLHKRRRWRARIFELVGEDHIDGLETPLSSPETIMDITLFYSALEKLGDKQRETIVLFDILGFSLEEIRQIQGGTVSGVKSRLLRGRHILSKLLGVEDVQKFSSQPSADNASPTTRSSWKSDADSSLLLYSGEYL